MYAPLFKIRGERGETKTKLITLLFLAGILTIMCKTSPVKADYLDVDLSYLIKHIQEFEGVAIRTNGTVKFYTSFIMHEDFWLQAPDGLAVPVEIMQNDLPRPPENLPIIVEGVVVWHSFEGGFYSIHADSWISVWPLPEFPTFAVLPLLVAATLVVVTVRRKYSKP